MKITSRSLVLLFFVVTLAGFQMWASEASAQSSYFTSRGCVDCHAAPTVATCAGCHKHSGTLTATKNKTTSYAPNETVTITLTSSGAKSGWIGARLYNQSGSFIASSTGNQSGQGGSAVYPAVLSAPAPATAGTYTWKIAYFGNNDGTGTGDVHSEKSVNVSFTVASAADTTVPVVTFTLPTTATSLTVPATFSATDNVGVTGYLINKSATAPTTGWLTSAPTSVTAVAGSNTFYAWARDAAGNVSLVKSDSVTVTLPDTTVPVVTFTLPATATSLTVPATFSATDNVGVTGYLITTSATIPTTGWLASAPASVTAVAGSNTFYAWARDAAGNVSLVKSASVTVTIPPPADTTVPVISNFTLPSSVTSLTVPVTTFTATDNVGVTGYLINKSATAPTTGWLASAPTSVTAVAGSNTFYAWTRDAAGNISASISATVEVTTVPPTKIGVYDPAVSQWYIDFNGNGAWNGTPTDRLYWHGFNGVIPVTGDWNGDGITESGVYSPATAQWYLDYNGNGVWDGTPTDRIYWHGFTGAIPVTGDWNGDGKTDIGAYDPANAQWYLDYNGNGVWDGTPTDRLYLHGFTGAIPVTGDWNGDGKTDIGVYDPATVQWYLDYNGNGAWDGTPTDRLYLHGFTGAIPVSGDWNGDGKTEIGVYDPAKAQWYLDYNGNGVWDGTPTDRLYWHGFTGVTPITGKW